MVALDLGFIQIYRYGLLYVIAFIVSYIYIRWLVRKNVFVRYPAIDTFFRHDLDDLVIYVIAGILLGGRLGHILIYDFSYFVANPSHIFALQEGGMSFIGWMLWVTISVLLFKRNKHLNWSQWRIILDVILTIVPFWIMIWRIWNFLNQELYGIIIPQWYWWLSDTMISFFESIHIFHIYPMIDQSLRLNTNFLASFFEGFCVLVIMQIFWWRHLRLKNIIPGYMTGIFLIAYSFVRFFLEYVRFDSQSEFIWLFSKSQWFFVAFFLIGVYLISTKRKIQ